MQKVIFRFTLFDLIINLKVKTKFKLTTFIEPKSFSLEVGLYANRVKIVLKAPLKVMHIAISLLGLHHTRTGGLKLKSTLGPHYICGLKFEW